MRNNENNIQIKYFVVLFLFTLITLNVYSQKKLPDFSNCEKISEHIVEDTDFTLVMVAGAGCGYSYYGLEQLLQLDEKLNIIVVNHGTKEQYEEFHSKYADYFTFIDGNDCKYFKSKIFPKYYLYQNDKLIWKQKKYKKNTPEIIKQQLKRHNI
ncbi:MAG: hypothetical protein LBP67_02810 [Bacteroidales bacterium]|jgi:hypothetical protein|nr:hypothetical protein [Bacteroidales bacterium]